MSKVNSGHFFEDFYPGQTITHATPRTITEGDAALYGALYGPRFALQSSHAYAKALGYIRPPVDDLLTFHVVFGKTVSDISLNAVANLGYADVRFLALVSYGDTLHSISEVLGVKENSNGKTGVVYVRTRGLKDDGTCVLEYVRWVMVRKRDAASPALDPVVPELPKVIDIGHLGASVPPINTSAFDAALSGAPHRYDDYVVGEKIDHIDGMTVEEAEHQLATRLYQNTARVHFNQFTEAKGRFGKRLIYGGHVISLARALSFNGLGNAYWILGINAGQHTAPLFAGDTVFAWSEVLDKADLPGRSDIAALRLRLVASKNLECADFPHKTAEGKPADGVILDLDYWAGIIR